MGEQLFFDFSLGVSALRYIKNNDSRFYLMYMFFLLLVCYSVYDFMTSANISVRYGNRTGVHLSLIAMVVFFCTYYIFTFWRDYIFSPVKLSLWLIAGWSTISFVFHSKYDWSATIHLGLSFLWILIYHFFSHYLCNFPRAITQIKVGIAIMFLFYVFSAGYAMFFIHAHLAKVGVDRLAVVNLVYSVMVFVPWLSLVKNRKLRIFGIALVLLVVLGAMKRGAIIVLPLMLSTWMAIEAVVEKKNFVRPMLKIVFLFGLFAIGLFVADQFSNGFLSDRFSSKELADGSGRAGALIIAFKEISKWSFTEQLLGTGKGFFSHNDWLEFLYLHGLVGVILYAALFCALIVQVLHLIWRESPYAPGVAMVLVYISVVGMFGAIYFVHSTLYLMAFLGVVEGLKYNDLRNKQTSFSTI